METVNGWGAALLASTTAALTTLLAVVPRVIGFLLIVLIGWFIASALRTAAAALLRAIHFNDLARRAGMSDFVKQMGLKTDASGLLADVVMWFVRLIVLVVGFDALGLPAVSQVLAQFLLFLPNVVVAIVILVIAGLAATALSTLVRGATAEAGFDNPDALASVARVVVWGFGIIIAVNQIGIAATLINTLLIGFVGAIALALGLSFGMGGREVAAQIVKSWYEQGKQAGPKVERAAQAAQQQASSADPAQSAEARTPARTYRDSSAATGSSD